MNGATAHKRKKLETKIKLVSLESAARALVVSGGVYLSLERRGIKALGQADPTYTALY